MPSAETDFTCSGNLPPEISASSAGTRLSRISVVFPEPDAPVMTVSLPFGMSTSNGLTVWIGPVERWIAPSANSSDSELACSLTRTSASWDRNGPICEIGFSSISATDPSAMMCPPSAPPRPQFDEPVRLP